MLKKLVASLKNYELSMVLIMLLFVMTLLIKTAALQPSSREFPLLIGWFTLLLLGIQLYIVLKSAKSRADESKKTGKTVDSRLIGFITMLFVYWVLIDKLGYYTSTVIFLALCMWILGMQNKWKILAVTIGATAFSYVLFTVIFNLRLPAGYFF